LLHPVVARREIIVMGWVTERVAQHQMGWVGET
jgi:hypothetical protein